MRRETTASHLRVDGIVVSSMRPTVESLQHTSQLASNGQAAASQDNFWKHCYLDPPDLSGRRPILGIAATEACFSECTANRPQTTNFSPASDSELIPMPDVPLPHVSITTVEDAKRIKPNPFNSLNRIRHLLK